ncbi:hypothetical protein ABH926_003275 [Catenulispora sp. GP43]|uniref:hypothetical protein n=1 Tax=Catenulispora sp. GP43 TaxID=3156263 RepID=UPI0035158435
MTTAPDPAAAARPQHRIPARSRRAPRGLSPSPGVSGRALAILGAAAVALVVAFVLAPAPLAALGPHGGFSGQQALRDAFSKAFVDYWKSGDRHFSPSMQNIVDYWLRYHVAKAVIAAALLAVFVVLGVLLWRVAVGLGVLMAILALVAAAMVAANVQGAAAPFSSLLSMLPTGPHHGDLATAISQIEQHLVRYPHQTSAATPAVQVMVDDFGYYHAVLAVVAAIVSGVLITLSVMSWRRRASRAMLWCAVLTAMTALAVLVVTAANISTAADPAPALLAFFQGGW